METVSHFLGGREATGMPLMGIDDGQESAG